MAKKKKSPWPVLIAIVLGIIVGTLTGQTGSLFGINLYNVFDVVGKLFINSLTLIVVPLVSSAIISGVARIGGDDSFGRLGFKIFSFYIGTSLMAILIGLAVVNLFDPGSFYNKEALSSIQQASMTQVQAELKVGESSQISNIILQIVPANIVDAFNGQQMLGLIFFSMLFGYAISKIESHSSSLLYGFSNGVFQAMLVMTNVIMKVLPIGVFCLVAKSFAVSGLTALSSLAMFALTVVTGLALFMFVGLPLLLKFIAKVDPFLHLKAMYPALITAFSTSSSSATLPVTIECVEKRAGVSNRITSLVVPLGTSINMSGSALYECVAALFIAQVYGAEMSILKQFIVVFLALITSIGVAGIPSASIVAILVILKTLGVPAEGIGLLFAVDRILDMCRTTVNVFSDSCCAVLVAASEGEKDVLKEKNMVEI
jgi:Na+/H+-dicarboxylate symporter